MKNRFFIFLNIALALLITGRASAQAKSSVEDMVQAKDFLFKAQTALPTGGSTRQLTSDFDITLNGDSLVSVLPYFGRAFVAPMTNENPLRFTSTDFDYGVKKKKNRWEVTIRPKDQREVRQLYLVVGEDGYGNLQVISNNRQPISYYGYIVSR